MRFEPCDCVERLCWIKVHPGTKTKGLWSSLVRQPYWDRASTRVKAKCLAILTKRPTMPPRRGDPRHGTPTGPPPPSQTDPRQQRWSRLAVSCVASRHLPCNGPTPPPPPPWSRPVRTHVREEGETGASPERCASQRIQGVQLNALSHVEVDGDYYFVPHALVRREIVRIYTEGLNGDLGYSDVSKMFRTTDFGHREIRVERPLRLRFGVTDEALTRLRTQRALLPAPKGARPHTPSCAASTTLFVEEVGGNLERHI